MKSQNSAVRDRSSRIHFNLLVTGFLGRMFTLLYFGPPNVFCNNAPVCIRDHMISLMAEQFKAPPVHLFSPSLSDACEVLPHCGLCMSQKVQEGQQSASTK